MDESSSGCSIFAVLTIVLISVLCEALGACNVSRSDSLRTLQHEGVTNIQLRGHAWFDCGNDSFATSFQGNKNGQPVEGALCAGWFKNITIRYK